MPKLNFDNIFDAVTDDKEASSELQVCSSLMITIRDIIVENGWKPKEAATIMELTQSRLSDLMNGKLDKFCVDELMNCRYRIA